MIPQEESKYHNPLQDQRVFGTGIRRKKINFVASGNDTKEQFAPKVATLGAGDRYLAIVLNKSSTQSNHEPEDYQGQGTSSRDRVSEADDGSHAVCDICHLPMNHAEAEETFHKLHETSLAHQICLEHSHPPSHLDRNRPGLKYLSSYGWDPDERRGLGASGTGIRIPIKPKPKNDTLGLGLLASSPASKVLKPTTRKLDAKQTRKSEAQAQKDGEKLRSLFYQHEDVDKYLGSNG
ncbi:MAG: hypothetical protein LQ345_002726 [Seirophora villosa]|nr:MAG: hypothetical protein LQ345_002726 [Seirophora villosa]